MTYYCSAPTEMEGGDGGQVGRLLWTDDEGQQTASFALTLPTVGWVGLSFTSAGNAGSMVPAWGVIGRVLPTGQVDCAAYSLTAPTLQGVQRDASLQLLQCGVVQRGGNETTLYFTRPFAGNGWPLALGASQPVFLNWAFGTTSQIGYHGPNRGSLSLSALSGNSTLLGDSGIDSDTAGDRARRIHGILMVTAFAGLMPLGVGLGRFIQRRANLLQRPASHAWI